MINNSTFYDLVYLEGSNLPTIETTITKVFLSLQSQVLNSFLWAQIFYLLLVILTIEMIKGKVCTWDEFFNTNKTNHEKLTKIVHTVCYVSLPLALFGVLLCISIKMELNL